MSTAGNCAIKSGVVHHTLDDSVFVEITALSACSSCDAKGACGSAESGQRLIEASSPEGKTLTPGEEVWIHAHPRTGHQAVGIGYFIPFLLVVIILIVASQFTGEMIAGGIALLSLIPYYFIVYIFRNRIKNHFQFTLSLKTDSP